MRRIVIWMAAALLPILLFVLVVLVLHQLQVNQLGPLQKATRNGDLAEMKRLLDSGTDINQRCHFRDWTALHVAADEGQVEAAAFLLERGASVSATDDSGFTALAVAGRQPNGRGQPKSTEGARNRIAERLLEHGADPDATSKHGDTPLMGAVDAVNEPQVVLLLKWHADPYRKDADGVSAFEIAKARNLTPIVKDFEATSQLGTEK